MSRPKRAQSGVTLLELVVATGIFAIVALVTGELFGHALHWSDAVAARNREQTAVEELTARWQADADAAWAITAQGNQLQFYRRDGFGQTHVSTYLSPIAGVGTFSAQTYPVTALQDPASPIYNPLFAGAQLVPAAVEFEPGSRGGNAVTAVTLASAHYSRTLLLVTRTAPSGFTIVMRYTPSPSASPAPQPSGALYGWQQRHEQSPGSFDTGANYQVYVNWYVTNALAGTWTAYCTESVLTFSAASTTTSPGNCDGFQNTQMPASPPPGVLGP